MVPISSLWPNETHSLAPIIANEVVSFEKVPSGVENTIAAPQPVAVEANDVASGSGSLTHFSHDSDG